MSINRVILSSTSHKHLKKILAGFLYDAFAEKSVESKGSEMTPPRSVIDRFDLSNVGYRSDRSTWLLPGDRKKLDASTLEDEMSLAFVCTATSYITYTSCFFPSDYRYTPRELNNLLNKEFRASVIHSIFRLLTSPDIYP